LKSYAINVIGGGSGGLTVAAGAVAFGVKVALIEKEPEPGGDCLHTGYVPSKALIAAAKELHTAKNAAKAEMIWLDNAGIAGAVNRIIGKTDFTDLAFSIEKL
jgi:pyruvate/2-oxoglutarate dehydrogenase complex dihydrolipoamide dehydrogenase (E3) component